MYINTKKKNIFIALFLLVIVSVGVGYALITSNVEVKGTMNISAMTWDIHFEDLEVADGSVSVLDENVAKIDDGKTTITYNVSLAKPGDFYEFTVNIVNNGTLDAKIEKSEISMTNVTTGENVDTTHADPKDYMNFTVVDADTGNPLALNEVLKAGGSRKIKVRVEYRNDISADDLPSKPQTIKLVYTLNYIQA